MIPKEGNTLLQEVRHYCYTMLQRIKRASIKSEWVMGTRVKSKFDLRRERTQTLKDYAEFARLENNNAVIDYISLAVDQEQTAYAEELASLATKLGKK
jgi:hypothetical protein